MRTVVGSSVTGVWIVCAVSLGMWCGRSVPIVNGNLVLDRGDDSRMGRLDRGVTIDMSLVAASARDAVRAVGPADRAGHAFPGTYALQQVMGFGRPENALSTMCQTAGEYARSR